MTGYIKLIAPIDPGGENELANLARRCNTTAKILTGLALHQLFVAAKAGIVPDMPPLADRYVRAYVWLSDADKATLDELSRSLRQTPEELASLAVRHLLAQARAGALPMLKPLEEAVPVESSWEELYLSRSRSDAKYLNDPEDTPDEAIARAARVNFSKALFAVERMLRLVSEGVDPSLPRRALHEIDELVTVRPS